MTKKFGVRKDESSVHKGVACTNFKCMDEKRETMQGRSKTQY